MDADDFQSIGINMLTPLIARLLGWAGATLATAGVTLNFGPDFALKVATILVGLAGVVAHRLMAKASQKSNAQSAFVQGAASAGMTILPHEIPPVVSASAPVPVATTPPMLG